MTVKLGYCIHCGQANITCINAQKDGTMTHYSIAKQGECGPLIIDDVEIPEPNWKAPAAITEGLREAFIAGAWWHLMGCHGALTHEKAHDEAKRRYSDAALRQSAKEGA